MRILLALLGTVSGLAVLLGALELADAMGKTGPVLFQQIGAMLLCGLPMIALCVCVAGLAVCGALDRMVKEAATRPVAFAGQVASAGDWVSPKHADVVSSPVKPETAEWWSDKNHPLKG